VPAAGTLTVGSSDVSAVKALQRALRALGYLRSGIDGSFGQGTAGAIRALTWDLINNHGASTGNDGSAPIAISSFNRGRVTGIVDQADDAVRDCIADLMASPNVPKLPFSIDPRTDNDRAIAAIRAIIGAKAPPPFMVAMIEQESSGAHFRVPFGNDEDNFVTVGLDRNEKSIPDRITSRGYGLGQYTLFHHPPRPEEIQDFIVDPARNVQKAFGELREKFDKWVAGPIDKADDRTVEHPILGLRICKYQPTDKRFMRDCQACAATSHKVEIERGTPAYAGANFGYQPDQYYPSATYHGVPNRADFLCDWPYAARRYNGSGNDSFHYQTRILLNLLAEPPVTWS
jgi:hypothetical protein